MHRFFGLTMMQNRRYYELCWDESLRLKLFVSGCLRSNSGTPAFDHVCCALGSAGRVIIPSREMSHCSVDPCLHSALNAAQMGTVTDCDWWRFVTPHDLQALDASATILTLAVSACISYTRIH